MENEGMPISEYEELVGQFNPTGFDAEEWATIAKAAGVRYVTITSKHHDGFAMYDTRLSSYKITSTPFARDVMSELSEALRKHGIKLFFYYSQLDWHHGDYYPLGRTGQRAGRAPGGDWAKYLEYYRGQVEELCSRYGEIGGIWFDGQWDKPDADWNQAGVYRAIHARRPMALIGSNHHAKPLPGEDFQIFEQDIPGDNTAGFNAANISSLPLETCLTINRSWGYNRSDHDTKSVKELIGYLVKVAGLGANLLLNVGPMPDGRIQPDHVERLSAIGDWLRVNGESIYGTRKGPYQGLSWGASTQRGSKTYLHVLDPGSGTISLPRGPRPPGSAALLDGTELRTSSTGDTVNVIIPAALMDPIDTIIVLEGRD
jgi:alpha-L-fucosidase